MIDIQTIDLAMQHIGYAFSIVIIVTAITSFCLFLTTLAAQQAWKIFKHFGMNAELLWYFHQYRTEKIHKPKIKTKKNESGKTTQ